MIEKPGSRHGAADLEARIGSSFEFYDDIPTFDRFSEAMESGHYRRVPDDWHVVLTDVVGSTQAIAENRYKDVNMLGASSIVAILNAVGRHVPFVFGGDGATVLVHESEVDRVLPALAGARQLARAAFGMELRAGVVPVRDLNSAGKAIEVARFRVSTTATLAMLRGGGLSLAETWIKSAEKGEVYAVADADESKTADFKGLSCRWNPVPAQQGEMISLLVQAIGPPETSPRVYSRVLAAVESILGDEDSHPVTVQKLDSSLRLRNLRAEILLRGHVRSWWLAPWSALRILGSYLFVMLSYRFGLRYPFFDPMEYVADLAVGTDFRKFDDMLRMVRDCDRSKRERLIHYLEEQRRSGAIVYGLHVSTKAMMTCLMFNRQDHVHFIDGADGGYAMAARQLKAQLRDLARVGGP